jgi:DNA-binding LacI/PurR family transcriptional regulator
MRRTTIKDIAEMLGINVSTVSRALSGHPDVNETVRNKIKSVAKDLGYHPNAQAISFRKQRSRLLGLIIPEISMFFFPSVIKAIQDAAYAKGYNLLVLQSNDDLQREIENVDVCYNANVEGIIISLSRNTFTLDHFQQINQHKIPIVFFDKVIKQEQIHTVVINDYAASYKALIYLSETGCNNIWGIFGSPNLTLTQKRIAGFRDALIQSNKAHQTLNLRFVDSSEEAKQAVHQLLETEKPDGIFAMSDEILIGALSALNERKIEIPTSCSLIGMSDGFLPYFLEPKITFIRHSGYEEGLMAMNRLFDLIEGKTAFETYELHLETQLIIQKSTR